MDYAQMLAQYRAQRSPPAAAMGGTVDYAQLLAERRAQRQAQAVNEYNPAAGMSVIEKGLVGLGRGFTDAIEGAKQAGLAVGEKLGLAREGAAQGYAEAVRPERELFERGLGNDTAASIGRVVGETAPLLAVPVGGAATAGGRVGLAAATGAGTGAIQLVDEDKGQSRLGNTLAGAAIGAGGGVAVEGLARVGGKLLNTVKGTTANPDAKAVLDAGAAHGIPVYAQDVSNNPLLRSATTTAEQLPLVGLAGARQTQQDAAKAAAARFRDQFADVGEDTGNVVQTSLANRTQRLQQVAGKKYDRVAQLADPLGSVPLPKLQNTVKQLADESKAIPDVTGGRGAANQMLEQLDQLAQSGNLTFSQLRAVRSDLGKSIRELERSASENRFERLRGLQQAKAAITEDLDAFASRSNSGQLKQAWRAADAFYKNRVVPQRARDIQRVAEHVNPDEAYSAFLKAGTNQDRAKRLYQAIGANGRQAVRYGIVRDAYSKAIREGTAGEVFSPAKFAGELERLQGATGVFFKGADKQQLDGLIKVMRHVQRAGQFAENPPTGARLLGPALMGGAGADLFLTGGANLTAGATSALVLKALTTTRPGIRFLTASSRLEDGSPRLARLVYQFEQQLPKLLANAQGDS